MNYRRKEEKEVKKDEGAIVRFNKPKSLELFLGIVFIFLCISSLIGINDLLSKDENLSLGLVLFNSVITGISGYFGLILLIRDKMGYIRLENDFIGFNKTFKERRILLKDISKVLKVTKREKLIAYRILAKEIILEFPMDYYKEEEINRIKAYLKSKKKL